MGVVNPKRRGFIKGGRGVIQRGGVHQKRLVNPKGRGSSNGDG